MMTVAEVLLNGVETYKGFWSFSIDDLRKG